MDMAFYCTIQMTRKFLKGHTFSRPLVKVLSLTMLLIVTSIFGW